MKKFNAMLSLAAIVVSALFVSCAQKKTPDVIPAFPNTFITATASLKVFSNGTDEEWSEIQWDWNKGDDNKDNKVDALDDGIDHTYTPAKGLGFVDYSAYNSEILGYAFTPNFDWTAEIVGVGKEYVQVGWGTGNDAENFNFGTSISGKRGRSTIFFNVIKTPESFEEPIECFVALTMNGETINILSLIVNPKEE